MSLLRTWIWLSVWGVGITGAMFVFPSAAQFGCAENKCGQISTCAEAYYKLVVCGHRQRDGDRDGIPCEKLCGKTKSIFERRLRAQMPPNLLEAIRAGTVKPGANDAGSSALSFTDQGAAENQREAFSCGGKKYCRDMGSCAEARFHLTQCGVTRLDGDGDGVPCNSLCR